VPERKDASEKNQKRQLRGKTETRRFLQESGGVLKTTRQLVLLLQDWDDPYNVGSLFRVADACGADEVILTGKTPAPPHPQISVTSLGNHRRVSFRQIERHDEVLAMLRSDGYQLVAVEVAAGALSYRAFEFADKVCLVLGNERKGVYPNVLRQCDGATFIPMAGKGRSMNVVVAGAIVAYEALLRE